MPTEEVTMNECPFCGAENALACQLDTNPTTFYAVICQECSAQGPTVAGAQGRPSAFADAIDVWNQRDVEAYAAASDEALEDAVIRRPDVLQRVMAGAFLARAVAELIDLDVPRKEIANMVMGSLGAITEDDHDDG